jgi:uncharacterized membrane protein YfcA
MEALVNAVIGLVLLVFDVVRGLLEWSDKALVVGVAVAAGTYLGMRLALTDHRI